MSADNRPSIVLQPLPRGEPRVLARGGSYGRYVAGHILFVRDETLFAIPFDLDALTPIGSPVPILDGVASGTLSFGAQFSVSQSGTLAYIETRNAGGAAGDLLQRVTQSGVTAMRQNRMRWGTPRFSPGDGRKLALTIEDAPGDDNIWVLDLPNDTLTPIAQYPGNDGMPIWTPEGRGIVFGSTQNVGPYNLYWQRADGVGTAVRLTDSPRPQLPRSMRRLPNGEVWLTYHEGVPPRQDSVFVRVEGDDQVGWRVVGEPLILPGGEFRNVFPTLSPDGRWVAYLSDRSGTLQLYVRRFPSLDTETPVSNGLANDPVWSERARSSSTRRYRSP